MLALVLLASNLSLQPFLDSKEPSPAKTVHKKPEPALHSQTSSFRTDPHLEDRPKELIAHVDLISVKGTMSIQPSKVICVPVGEHVAKM